MRGTVGWRRAAEALLPLTPHRDARIDAEDVMKFVHTDATSSAAAELLGGPDFTLRQLQDRAADPDFERRLALNSRKKLHAEMLQSADPAAVNRRLNEVECDVGCDELLSFPTFVGLNMSSVCNARCVFCSYQPSMLKERDHIGLADLKKMTWLRYVKDFAIWGGIGDSLDEPRVSRLLSLLEGRASAPDRHLFDQRHPHDRRALRGVRRASGGSTTSRSTPRGRRPGKS